MMSGDACPSVCRGLRAWDRLSSPATQACLELENALISRQYSLRPHLMEDDHVEGDQQWLGLEVLRLGGGLQRAPLHPRISVSNRPTTRAG